MKYHFSQHRPRRWVLMLGLALAGVALCHQTALTQNKTTIRFRDITGQAGLKKPLAGIMGHGGAFGDFDGDGWIDIFVGGFCDRPDEKYKPAKGPVPNRLLRNIGGKKFVRVQQKILEYYGRTSGAVFADLDNDGDLDLYSANNTKGRSGLKQEPQRSAQLRYANLFRNDNGKFVDISVQSGACPKKVGTARNIGVFDYNGDGLLDLFVVEDRFTREPSSVLLRNKGNLRFEDVSQKMGLPDDMFGLGLAVADINEDGKPDFFVPHSNRMFLSSRGKYVEHESLTKTFAWKPLDNEDWPCGAAFGDLNRDGKLDLVVSIHAIPARNKIYLNQGLKNGVPQFRDVTEAAGFGKEVPIRCPHIEIQDFNNDGWPDIYMSAAWMDKNQKITPLIFENLGGKGVPRFRPPQPIKGPMVYYPAGPTGDFDKDGRMDIFLINWFEGNFSRLIRNESAKRHWLDVRFVGKKMNRMGIGAQVKLYRAGGLGKQSALLGFQEVTTGYGYASGQPAVCHFGLGDETAVDVAVKLPNGKSIERRKVKVDKRLIIEEPVN